MTKNYYQIDCTTEEGESLSALAVATSREDAILYWYRWLDFFGWGNTKFGRGPLEGIDWSEDGLQVYKSADHRPAADAIEGFLEWNADTHYILHKCRWLPDGPTLYWPDGPAAVQAIVDTASS